MPLGLIAICKAVICKFPLPLTNVVCVCMCVRVGDVCIFKLIQGITTYWLKIKLEDVGIKRLYLEAYKNIGTIIQDICHPITQVELFINFFCQNRSSRVFFATHFAKLI